MAIHSDSPETDGHSPNIEIAREAALEATRRAENARKWLARGHAVAYLVGLFLVLSAAKSWMPSLSDRTILIVVIVIGVGLAMSRLEEGR